MQKEIEYAQTEVKKLEDQVLERMVEGDDLAAAAKRAEAALAAEQKSVDADRKALGAEVAEQKASLEQAESPSALAVVSSLNPQVLSLFEQVSRRRNGVAVAEARDGICTICHVRLRPQVFNTVLRGDEILQCDHCNRILFSHAGGESTRRRGRELAPLMTETMANQTRLVAYIDGGSRGNPGPAGFGVRVEQPDGTLVEELAESIGVATNNVAEYRGLIAALEWARTRRGTRAARPLRLPAAGAADAGPLPREAPRASSPSMRRPGCSPTKSAR